MVKIWLKCPASFLTKIVCVGNIASMSHQLDHSNVSVHVGYMVRQGWDWMHWQQFNNCLQKPNAELCRLWEIWRCQNSPQPCFLLSASRLCVLGSLLPYHSSLNIPMSQYMWDAWYMVRQDWDWNSWPTMIKSMSSHFLRCVGWVNLACPKFSAGLFETIEGYEFQCQPCLSIYSVYNETLEWWSWGDMFGMFPTHIILVWKSGVSSKLKYWYWFVQTLVVNEFQSLPCLTLYHAYNVEWCMIWK